MAHRRKRPVGSASGRKRQPYQVDFRSTSDDAWYGVTLRVEEYKGETFLRVIYCDFSEQWDERFSASRFHNAAELEAFRQRFRRTSEQMQDWDCRRARKGTLVCASSVINEEEVKFYDAVVESVSHFVHKIINGEENCICDFTLLWQHGPNAGTKTCTGIEHICLLQEGNEHIDSVLDLFLELSMKTLKLVQHRHNRSLESTIEHKCNEPDKKYKHEPIELVVDLDLGGDDMPMYADLGKKYYYLWIENLEKDLLPEAIIGFLHCHTAISPRAFVYPTLHSMPYTRASIFVDMREKTVKLSDFLCNPAHMIMSINGRPWVISEKKWNYGTLAGFIPSLEMQPTIDSVTHSDKIILVYKGTKEFEKGMRRQTLFLEFHEHMLRLHRRLIMEEIKIMKSNDESING